MSIVTKLFPEIADVASGAAKKLFDAAPSKVELPPAENSRLTQIVGTTSTYEKAYKLLDDLGVPGDRLDFGAGLGVGTQKVGAMTYEPFPPPNFKPDFQSPDEIPSDSFSAVTNFNVLNVVPRETRDEIVQNIGRILKPEGTAIITTRGKDVLNAKGTPGNEPMSLIIGNGAKARYQKGFTQKELQEYIQETLGSGFAVKPVKLGAAGVQIKKLPMEYEDITASTLPQPLEGL